MRKIAESNIIYKVLRKARDLSNQIFKDTRQLLAAGVVASLVLFLAVRFKPVFFTIILIALGAVSMIYIRFFKYAHYIGLELCTMATVLTSLAYGPHYGATAGFASIFGAFIISGYFKPTYFISVLALPLTALIVPFLSELPLWQIGLIITIIFDAIILPLYIFMGHKVSSSIIFFITHVFLNYWVFSSIAPLIYSIIA